MQVLITMQFDGTNYHGFQVQKNALSVCEVLQNALERLYGERPPVKGCSRTDAGVHADAQVAHCDIPEERAHVRWKLALNTLLPRDIRVMDACLVPDDFDACFSVKRKIYTYSLWLDHTCTPPKLYPFVWACGPFDMDRFDAAIPYLVGEHDFAALQNAGTPHKSTVRTLYSIRRTPARTPYAALPENCLNIDVRFEGNGFLKQMVRNLVGLMVACGRGRFEPERIPELLESKNRRLAPFTAPPQGLTMTRIWYEGEPMPEGWEA